MSDISGHLVLLMAPSGSGKGVIMEGLGSLVSDLYFLRTYTSRARREGVEENPKYVFLPLEEFEDMIENNSFVEWANYSGNLYGTAKSDILESLHAGKVAFKEMELQGILQMKKIVPEDKVTVVYIDAGDWEALESRITARAKIDPVELELRRQRYEEESKWKGSADVIIENRDGNLEQAREFFRETIKNIIDNVRS